MQLLMADDAMQQARHDAKYIQVV